jgi:hypothetical protein
VSEAASGVYGGMSIPTATPAAGEAVTDPALSLVGLYLRAFVNAYGGAAWRAVAPGTDPVATVYTHDPRRRQAYFNEAELPAIFLTRTGGAPRERVAEELRIIVDTVALLWVFPLGKREQQRVREPFVAGLVRLIDRALDATRDPCFIVAGDTDPNAEKFGSDVFGLTRISALDFVRWDRATVDIRVEGGVGRERSPETRSYEAALVTLSLAERDVADVEDATEPVALSFTTTTPDGAVITAEYFNGPTP